MSQMYYSDCIIVGTKWGPLIALTDAKLKQIDMKEGM